MLKKKKVNVKPINHQEFGKMSYNIPVEVEKNNKVNEKEVLISLFRVRIRRRRVSLVFQKFSL